MLESRLFENKYFGTERFDRKDGQRLHVIPATGLSGIISEGTVDYTRLIQVTKNMIQP